MISMEQYSMGINDPGPYDMVMDGVYGICWFVVSACSGFGVAAVRGPAVLCAIGVDGWTSASKAFWLAGLKTSFVTCWRYGLWNAVFPYRMYSTLIISVL